MRSALSGITTGTFDQLLVRNPAFTGNYEDILSVVGGIGYDDTAVVADTATNTAGLSDLTTVVSGKMDDGDAYPVATMDGLLADKVSNSRVLTDVPANAVFTDTIYEHPSSHSVGFITGLQAALDDKVASSRVLTDVPADAKFTDKDTLYVHPSSHPISMVTGLQTALDGKVPNSRVLTDVPVDAVFSDTIYTAPGSRPISYITGLQGELNNKAGQSATTVALSNKVDKEGSISESESNANLLARVQTAVPSGALFTDTVFNVITDIPDGSLDIIQVAGLNAALGTFQSTIGSGDLSFAMTSGLQLALNTLATDIAAIPTSQVILANGTFVNQHRFGIENGDVVLDLNLGWLFRATPLWSQLRNDPTRIRHARLGHLPLDPAADCLCYLPMISSHSDMSPANLHLVQVDTSATQGEYGVYEHVPPTVMTQGYPLTSHTYLFPNRSVPGSQVSGSGIGWPADSASSFLLEWQVFVPADCSTGVNLSSDADASETPPEDIIFINLDSVTAELQVRWDDKTGGDNFNRIIVPNMVFANQVYSVAVQKSAGADVLRVYLNGELKVTETVGAPLTTVDIIRFQAFRTGTPMIREFSARTNAVLPEIPYGPGGSVTTSATRTFAGTVICWDE